MLLTSKFMDVKIIFFVKNSYLKKYYLYNINMAEIELIEINNNKTRNY